MLAPSMSFGSRCGAGSVGGASLLSSLARLLASSLSLALASSESGTAAGVFATLKLALHPSETLDWTPRILGLAWILHIMKNR